VQREWELLSRTRGQPEVFVPALVADHPEPARRWLTHAIAPGTPLWPTVELSMRGQIRLGAWRPFTARQVLTPPRGFIWAATACLFGVPVIGFDRLSGHTVGKSVPMGARKERGTSAAALPAASHSTSSKTLV
jgi:hypothetical protein